MAQAILHETEVHRQHVRLRIPIGAEIDGLRFTVDDWSLGGFGVLGALPQRRPGERFPVRLHLPFEDFELALEVEAELVYRLDDDSRFGCRFVALSAGQQALFRYVVDAYLSGELVQAGDLLAVHARSVAPIGAARAAEARPRRGLAARLRTAVGVLAGLSAGAGLLVLGWLGVRERWLVVRAEAAIVAASVVRVAAPAAGRLEPAEVEPVVPVGGPLGALAADDGTLLPLASPCECALLEWLASAGQRVEAGETVALLASVDEPLVVRASVPPRPGRMPAPGDPAEIRLPGGGGTVRGRVERIDLKGQLLGLAAGDPLAAARRPLLLVVRPERPLDFELLGTPVEVRFF